MNQMEAIRYAMAVRKTGSFSAAAELLYMAQPNLSRLIRKLEQELGIVLFVRKSSGVIPTPEGERFLSEAKLLLEKYDALLESCRKNQRRTVSIAAQPLLVYSNYLADLTEQYEGAVISQSCEFPALLQLVSDQTVDVSLVCIPEYIDAQFERILAEQKLVFHRVCRSDTYFCYQEKAGQLLTGKTLSEDTLRQFNFYYYIDWKGMGMEEKTPIPVPYRTVNAFQVVKMAGSDPSFAMLTVHPYEEWYASLGLKVARLENYPWGYHYGYIRRIDSGITPLCEDILRGLFQAIQNMMARYGRKYPALWADLHTQIQ